MKKFGEWLEKTMRPIASKVARNPYVETLSQTFISLLPIIVIGAFALILSKSPVNYTGFAENSYWYNFFKGWTDWTNANLQTLKYVNTVTLGSLSLWVAIGIGYRWAKKYEISELNMLTVVVVCFLIINSGVIDGGWSTTYFGGTGLFSAIVFSFLSAQLYRTLITKGIGRINFPATVPASLTNAMSSMLPMAITFAATCIVAAIPAIFLQTSIPALIMKIGAPLSVGIDNPLGISFVTILGQISFWFGIHNSAVLSVFSPILYANLSANAEAFAAGVSASQVPFIVNQSFFYSFVGIGGAGATFGLVLLLLKSKSDTLRAVGKLSIIPACFGINEPVIFGLPIMMNVTLLLPFLLVQVVNIIICYSAMALNLLNKPIFYFGGTAPEILKAVLSNMDWRSIIYWIVAVAVDTLLYYPFFKLYERQVLEREAAEISETDKNLQISVE